jgi:histidine triad (HIT) family protein
MLDANESCVFCKIVAGEIPSSKIFEDAHCLAFLDIGPLAPGHLLIIPKQHAECLWDLDASIVAGMGSQLPRLARAVMDATGAEGCNILQNNGPASGQEVPHVHFHIIPRQTGDGLGYRWLPKGYGPGELEAMQQKILGRMG